MAKVTHSIGNDGKPTYIIVEFTEEELSTFKDSGTLLSHREADKLFADIEEKVKQIT